MAKSPCVRAEHEIFDGFEGKVHGVARSDDAEQWTPAGRRAALDGLMDLAAGAWNGYHDRVPSKLWAWTNHTRELMNKHNETMAPIAVGLKWMAGHAKGNGHGGKAFEIVDNQGFEASLEWLLPLAKARGVKFVSATCVENNLHEAILTSLSAMAWPRHLLSAQVFGAGPFTTPRGFLVS